MTWYDDEFNQIRKEESELYYSEVQPFDDEIEEIEETVECTCHIDEETCLVHHPELNETYQN